MDSNEAHEALDQLDEAIQRMKIDFERFFNGALPFPPDTYRARAFRQVQRLRSQHHKSAVVRFRLNSLEAKLNSLSELFNRRLRELETRGVRTPGTSRKRPADDHDPYAGVRITRDRDQGAIESLYTELYGERGRGAKTDLDSFRGFLESQAETIRRKTGCDEVVFRVVSDRGKLKLKARPAEPAGS